MAENDGQTKRTPLHGDSPDESASIRAPEIDFNPPVPASERTDFPTAEFVLDQFMDAADDVRDEILANAAVKAIEQRDAIKAVLSAALDHLHSRTGERDQLRRQLAELRGGRRGQ